MPRPGAVIEVDRTTPPVLFHFGEGVRLEKLPLGARIVYPPDPLEPLAHPERAIKRALAKPLEDDPLKGLLRRGMKLTIAFDDLSLPLPPMAAPDVRQLVMEEVIDMAAEAGVEDIHLIAAPPSRTWSCTSTSPWCRWTAGTSRCRPAWPRIAASVRTTT